MVSRLNAGEMLNFLIIVCIILVTARLLGEVFRKLKQPVVVGEILAGIIIGPSFLGGAFPQLYNQIFISQPRSYGAFDGLASTGLILLMFVAGIEVDLKQIRTQGKAAAAISIFSMLLPFAIGFLTVWFFHDSIFNTAVQDRFISSMFFGTALSITALAVIAKVLFDLHIIRTRVGGLVLTAAMINDFIGWILFSIIIKMMGTNHTENSFMSIVYVLAFVAFVMTIGRWMVDKILAFATKYLTPPGGVITVAICLCFFSALTTEWLGIRGIFGAFLMGISVGDSKHFSESAQHLLQQFVVNIIAPLFFASIGLLINFVTNFDFVTVSVLLLIACTGKLIGAGLGARFSGISKNETIAIAFGMNARGSQEIVLGLLAMQAGIIDSKVFEAFVVMTMITVLMAGPLMKHYLSKEIQKKQDSDTNVVLIHQSENQTAAL